MPAGQTPLEAVLGCSDPGFLDFLTSLLQIDPALRPTARAALMHPWLREALPFEPYVLPPEPEPGAEGAGEEGEGEEVWVEAGEELDEEEGVVSEEEA